MKKQVSIFFAIFSLQCLLSACVSNTTNYPALMSQSYNLGCPARMIMPRKPVCLIIGNFRDKLSFQSCRESMNNYAEALDDWAYCAVEDARGRYNSYIEESKKTLSCVELALTEQKQGSLSQSCQPVEIDIDKYFLLTPSYKNPKARPLCIGKEQQFPKNNSELETCVSEVLDYVKDAKNKIENAPPWLQGEIKSELSKAINLFNCIADGKRFCY